MLASRHSRRNLRLFGFLTFVAALAYYIHSRPTWRQRSYSYARTTYNKVTGLLNPIYNNTLYREGDGRTAGNEDTVFAQFNYSDPCSTFPNTDGIVVVMKTGATEAFDRIPTHLLTTLQCLPDFLLFSDMEQQVGKHYIYDALEDFAESAKAHNEDFDLYRDQKECPVSQKSCVDARDQGSRAWNLDRYKFLPMIEKTWKLRPNQDWYVFLEADSYPFWANMVEWLRIKSKLDPRDKHYIGSRSFIGGTPFAHGGSGYVVSGMLMKHLIEHHPGVVEQYNIKGAHECCGDLMLAQAFEEYENLHVKQAWPMFNGEKPSTLPYGPGHWCEPILTMHHMNSEEISSVWQFEQTRKTDRTLMIRDLYEGLIAPKMQVLREHWDNLSDDVCYLNPDPEAQKRAEGYQRDRQRPIDDMSQVEKDAWKSPSHCAKVCEMEDVADDDDWETVKKKKQEAEKLAKLQAMEEEQQRLLEEQRELMPVNGEPGDEPPNIRRRDSKILKIEGDSAHANDTEAAEDTGASDAAARNAWKEAMREKKLQRSCFQYKWHDEVCCTSRSFKLGAPKARPKDRDDVNARWVSGWDLKGINDWIDAMGNCKDVAWKKRLD